MPSKSISVIIPAINEVRTIRGVIETVRSWARAGEIIVVIDEATSDGTLDVIKPFGKQVTVITNAKGKGKGDALATGVSIAKGDILLFVDADLLSLIPDDLTQLVKPLVQGTHRMAIGVLRYWKAGGHEPFNEISGTRSLYRSDLSGLVDSMRTKGYGIEVFFNGLFRKSEITFVRLPHVDMMTKFDKQSASDALVTYIIEARDLITEAINLTSTVTPKTKRILRGIQNYLKSALEYFS